MDQPVSSKKCVISVCVGDACADRKSKKVRARLKALVKKCDLEGKVKIKKSGCRGACSKGPIVEAKPGRHRFEHVKPKKAKKILKRVLGDAWKEQAGEDATTDQSA